MDYMDLCIPVGNGVLCMESLYSSGKSLWDGISMENADWSREDVAPSLFQDWDYPILPTLDELKDKSCLLIQIFKSGKEFFFGERGFWDPGHMLDIWDAAAPSALDHPSLESRLSPDNSHPTSSFILL